MTSKRSEIDSFFSAVSIYSAVFPGVQIMSTLLYPIFAHQAAATYMAVLQSCQISYNKPIFFGFLEGKWKL
jgi:hypothetical protein